MSSLLLCGKAVKIWVNYLFIQPKTYPHVFNFYIYSPNRQWETDSFTSISTHLVDRFLHTSFYKFQSVKVLISTQFTGPITTEYKI